MLVIRHSVPSSRATSIPFSRYTIVSSASTAVNLCQKGKEKATEFDTELQEMPSWPADSVHAFSEFESITRRYDDLDVRPPEKKRVAPRRAPKSMIRNFEDHHNASRLPPLSPRGWRKQTYDSANNNDIRPKRNGTIPISFGSGAVEGRVRRYRQTTTQRQKNLLRVVEALRSPEDMFRPNPSAVNYRDEAVSQRAPVLQPQESSMILRNLSLSRLSSRLRSNSSRTLARFHYDHGFKQNYSTSSPSADKNESTGAQQLPIPVSHASTSNNTDSQSDLISNSDNDLDNSCHQIPRPPGQTSSVSAGNFTTDWPAEKWTDDWGADQLAPPQASRPNPKSSILSPASATAYKSRHSTRAVTTRFVDGKNRSSLGRRLRIRQFKGSKRIPEANSIQKGVGDSVPRISAILSPLAFDVGSAQENIGLGRWNKRLEPDSNKHADPTPAVEMKDPRPQGVAIVSDILDRLSLTESNASKTETVLPPSRTAKKKAALAAKLDAKRDFLAKFKGIVSPSKRKEAKAKRKQRRAEVAESTTKGQLKPLPASVEVLEDANPATQPIPRLAHGLDRVLFNPSVHWVQDPHSRVFNFPPKLQSLPAVTEFAFERLGGYITSSHDESLLSLAIKHSKRFTGSTSSLTGFLSHIYFLISGDRPVDTSTLTMGFMKEPRSFTPGIRMPAAVVMHHRQHEVTENGSPSSSIEGDMAYHTPETHPHSDATITESPSDTVMDTALTQHCLLPEVVDLDATSESLDGNGESTSSRPAHPSSSVGTILDPSLGDAKPTEAVVTAGPQNSPTDPPKEPKTELSMDLGENTTNSPTEPAPTQGEEVIKRLDHAIPMPVDAGVEITSQGVEEMAVTGTPDQMANNVPACAGSEPVKAGIEAVSPNGTLDQSSSTINPGSTIDTTSSLDTPLGYIDPSEDYFNEVKNLSADPLEEPQSRLADPDVVIPAANNTQDSSNSKSTRLIDTYAIDKGTGDPEDRRSDELNVLLWLGTMAEKFLTLPEPVFTTLLRKNPINESLVDYKKGESYRYAKSSRFVMRSQLDCQDSRLPGTGVFDIKTRAVLPIRVDRLNYLQNAGYLIRTMTGRYESFEREYYDLIRSAFLKYNFQARIGNMDGVFVAYHNTARMFGFQYVPVTEMEDRIYGPGAPGRGAKIFEKCIRLLEILCEEVVACFPGESVACTIEARQGSGNLKIWVAPTENPDGRIAELTATVTHTLKGRPVNSTEAIDNAHDDWTLFYNITRTTKNPFKIWETLKSVKGREFASALPEGVSKDEMTERLALVDFGAGKGFDQALSDAPEREESTEDEKKGKSKFAKANSRVKFLRRLAQRGWQDMKKEGENTANHVVFGEDGEGVLRGLDNETIHPSTTGSAYPENVDLHPREQSELDGAVSTEEVGRDGSGIMADDDMAETNASEAEGIDGQHTSEKTSQTEAREEATSSVCHQVDGETHHANIGSL